MSIGKALCIIYGATLVLTVIVLPNYLYWKACREERKRNERESSTDSVPTDS